MMRYGMVLALVAVVVCGSFADSKGKKIKYISKYSTNKDSAVVECVFDDKTNQLISRKGDELIEVSQYKSRDEFIAERREMGRSFILSQKINEQDYKDDWTMKFDTQGRLIREEGNQLTLEWTAWDRKKRNTKGRLMFNGTEFALEMSVVYDDKNRSETTKMTLPESVGTDAEAGLLPESIIISYDEFNNDLSKTIVNFNGEKDVETKTVIEYKEME